MFSETFELWWKENRHKTMVSKGPASVLFEAGRKAEREAVIAIVDEHMPNCDGNGCDAIQESIRARGQS